MRYLHTILVFFLISSISPVYAQSDILWTESIDIADSDFGDRGPMITLNSENQPVVMWGRSFGSEKFLYTAVMVDNVFTEPIEISGDIVPFVHNTEGARIASNGNKIVVSFQEIGNDISGVYIVISEDGGFTWGDPIQMIEETELYHVLPDVAIDDEGKILVATLTSVNYFDSPILEFRSTIDGSSFSDPILMSAGADGEEVCECCPVSIETSGSEYFTFFRNNNDNVRDIWMSSYDSSDESEEILDCDTFDWVINACPASGPEGLINDEEIHLVYMAAPSGTSQVYFSSVDRGSNTLETNELITGTTFENSIQNRPKIAGDNDYVGVVWEQTQSGDRDLMFTTSTQGALGLPFDIENLGADTEDRQRYPSLAFDGVNFHLVYQEDNTNVVRYMVGSTDLINDIGEFDSNFEVIQRSDSNVQIKGNGILQVYDAQGKVVYSDKILESKTLDCSNWSNGMYVFKLGSSNQIKTKKLLIGY